MANSSPAFPTRRTLGEGCAGDTQHVDDPVQIFSEAVDALNRVDRAELQRLIDPEIVFVPMRSAVEGAYIGHDGMNDFLDDNAQMFEYFTAEFEKLEPLPDGRLLSIGPMRIKGRGGEG